MFEICLPERTLRSVKQKSDIVIQASLSRIFSTASDLVRWPEFLPHFRYNRFLQHQPHGGVVKMSCLRSGLVTNWISEFRIDTTKRQLYFRHLQSTFQATAGMQVLWNFKELSADVYRVSIEHELAEKRPLWGKAVNDWLLRKFFIHELAAETLAGLKRKVEPKPPLPVISVPVKSARLSKK